MKKTAKRIIKKIDNLFFNHKRYLLPKNVCSKAWYGSSYGGFNVNPDLIDETSIVYSFGIGEDISFDLDVMNKHKCKVFGFDPTPKSINWVKDNTPDSFTFFEYGLSNKSEFVDFYLPQNTEHVSGSIHLLSNVDEGRKVNVEMKSISDILSILKHDKIDVLKMDIEGSEYDVIDQILALEQPITQILIEFHNRFFEDGDKKMKEAINKIKRSGYVLFAISESKEELSFIKKTRLK